MLLNVADFCSLSLLTGTSLEGLLKVLLRLTNECADSPGHVHHPATGKVREALLCQPTLLGPAPVGRDGVDDPGHDGAEDDVALEVAALGDRARDDGGTGRGEGALDEEGQ